MEHNDQVTPSSASAPKVRPVYVTMLAASNDGLDLLELWRAVFAGKWLIIAITVVFAVASVVYSLLATPIYRAEALLAPASHTDADVASARLSGLASLAGVNLGADNNRVESMAVLQSRHFVAEFIRDKNLLPVLFPDQWDAQRVRWRSNSPQEQPDVRDGVELFLKNVRSVTEDAETGLVTLAVEWTDPQIVAQWVTELVERINSSARQRDIQESEQKLSYLYAQLEKANLVELRQAISRVIEDQINAMMLAQAQTEYAFTVIDPAVVPKQRIRPKRTLIVIVATFLGGFIGVFVVIARLAIKRLISRRTSASADS